MKLVNKFTLWFVCIMFICTMMSTVLNYYSVKGRLDKAATERLTIINNRIAGQLSRGETPQLTMHDHKVLVDKIAGPLPAQRQQLSRVRTNDPDLQEQECKLTLTSYYNVGNTNYRITSYNYIVRSDYILSGLEATIVWRWLIIVFLIAVSARLVSRLILKPFNKTLGIVERFSLRQKQKVQFQHTGTKEFKKLNNFLQEMTDKAVEDYLMLKEFSENASHELQTPVAVMRGKLELLAESGIRDDQAELIAGIQNAVEKLSRINSSLVLLTKLENHEYQAKKPLDISSLVADSLTTYQELMELKSLDAVTDIEEHVSVQLHPLLADLLLNNLLSNAIRHNVPDGNIHIVLNHSYLEVSNTGIAPEVPVEELFKRFKKSNQCANSVGIGLSIVKQICDLNGFRILYQYVAGRHTLRVDFDTDVDVSEKVSAGKVLQEVLVAN